MKTEAAVLIEPNRIEILDLEVPILRDGQVLVEIGFSGVCGTQLLEVGGRKGPDQWLPHCLGHEASGTIVDCGRDVQQVRRGDAVFLSWIAGDGADVDGTIYHATDGRKVNAGPVTTLQRYAVVAENRVTKLPAHISPEAGVLLGCAAPTGIGTVTAIANVLPGETVAVFGLGGVGLMACAAASNIGAGRIIGFDPLEARRTLATAIGATEVYEPVLAASYAAGVDVVIVTTGNLQAMANAVTCVRPRGGRVVVVGNPTIPGASLTIDVREFNNGKSVLGCWGGGAIDRSADGYCMTLMGACQDELRGILSAPYALTDISQAFEDFEAGRICRPLVAM